MSDDFEDDWDIEERFVQAELDHLHSFPEFRENESFLMSLDNSGDDEETKRESARYYLEEHYRHNPIEGDREDW
jgi:hypothetical protein